MTPAELNQELESGKFRPVYYLYGTEDYRIKEAEKAIVRRFLPKYQLVTNHKALVAAKAKLPEILTELSIIPMLGERQIFTLADVQSFSSPEIEKILSLLAPPDPNRLVIMTTPSEKALKKKSKALEFLIQKTAAIEFNRIPEDQARRRIAISLKDHSISIEPEAEKILVILSGGNLGGLTEEINKLISFVGEGGKITKEVISEISSDYQAYQIYELADLTARCDFDKSLAVINFLVKQGERISTLLFWMGEHFVDLYLVKNHKPLAAWKRGSSWKFNSQVELFTNGQLERIICLIAEADEDLRNNVRPEELILERLVFNICELRTAGRPHG